MRDWNWASTCAALPVLAYVSLISYPQLPSEHFSFVSVTVIGHLSTVYLAAATFGMVVASVTGYSIVQGTTTALDTLLLPAWTSDTPCMAN